MHFEQNIMMDMSRQSYRQQQEELAQRRVEEAAARCCLRGSSTTTTPSSSSSSSPFEYRETSRYEEKMMVDGPPQSSSTEAAAVECYDDGGSGQQHTTMQHSSSPIKRTITKPKDSKNKKKTIPYKLSEKDIFLYKLYNVLSTPSTTSSSSSSSVEGYDSHSNSVQNQQSSTVSQPQASTPTNKGTNTNTNNNNANEQQQPPRNPDIITWLPHGQGFTILQKTSFEKYILGYIIPNVKYASFVRRLKRYKFLRISSGPEMGAYYHPNFKRGQPNLLNLINTTDEIPIDKYGVDVNMAVTLSYSLPSNDDPTRTTTTTTTTTTAASTTAAPFSPRGTNNNDDDDASLLSLGTITPGGSIQGLTPSTTRGSRSSGRRKQRVGVEEDALMFDDLLLPFLDDVDDDDNNDGNGAAEGTEAAAVPPPHHHHPELAPPELDLDVEVSTTDFDSLQSPPPFLSKHTAVLTGRVENAVTSTSSSSSSSPEKIADISTTSRISPPPLPNGDIYAVQQQMLQQEQMLMLQQEQWQQDQLLLQQQQHQARFQQQQHMPMMQPPPGIVSPISPIRQAVTVSCLNNGNVGSNSIVNNAGSSTKSNSTKGVTVAKDMKSFPQMLRDISRQKRLRHMAQKKQQEQRSSTPPSSYSISSCFSNTTVINVPTSSMGGGGGMNIKKMFEYRRRGSAPDSQTSFNPTTMRQTGMKRSQYRRRGSNDGMMSYVKRGSNDGMMSYVKKASSSKYQYDRRGSADSMTFHRKGSSNYSRKSSYRRNNSCDAISSVFNTSQDHRMDVDLPSSTGWQQQQQQVEEQPYFVSMDYNEELEELRRQHQGHQQQQQHSNEEKLRRHRNHIRKDPYEELWRQVDEGSGGFQYQPNNVPDAPRSDLDLKYADYYKPVVGRDDCLHHQLQQHPQHQQACPPPNLLQHDDGHDYQKIAETLIMASDDEGDYHEEEQQTYLPHGMRYNGIHGNDCDDYEPLPIEKRFPRYSRRCTL